MTLPPVPHGDLICSYKFLELEIGGLSQETSVFQQQPKDHGKGGGLESPTLCEFRSRTCRAAGTNNSCPNSRELSQLRAPGPLQTTGHRLASLRHMGPNPSLPQQCRWKAHLALTSGDMAPFIQDQGNCPTASRTLGICFQIKPCPGPSQGPSVGLGSDHLERNS